MELKILFVDDDIEISTALADFFSDMEINGNILKTVIADSFDSGIEKIKQENFDIIVLDLCQGKPSEDSEKEGLRVLQEIQNHYFVPVIFYSGIANSIEDLKSDVVGIVNKSEGLQELKANIEIIITSNIALLKGKIHQHVEEELKKYFWDIVHEKRTIFNNENDFSLGYLLLRRLSHSLSKKNIKLILGDDKINENKAHPMEFYIFPGNVGEYEAGEILNREGTFFIVLTPSCDFILRTKKDKSERKVGNVLLGRIKPLTEFTEYTSHQASASTENKKRLHSLITNNQSDRYFFLPGTPFMKNGVIDFQNKIMVDYEELGSFQRIAQLDDPFAQSMISSFIRYYNRIGFPDIDPEYVISKF